MIVLIKYKDNNKEHFLQVCGGDIEVDLLTSNGIEIVPIPPEEYEQGFRAKEREA